MPAADLVSLGHMRTERSSVILSVTVGVLAAAAYVGAYIASVKRVRISWGNPSGSLLAFYPEPRLGLFFRPIEELDRWMFPERWSYGQSEQGKSAIR